MRQNSSDRPRATSQGRCILSGRPHSFIHRKHLEDKGIALFSPLEHENYLKLTKLVPIILFTIKLIKTTPYKDRGDRGNGSILLQTSFSTVLIIVYL